MKKKLLFIVIVQFVVSSVGFTQEYQYATFNTGTGTLPGNLYTGTGSFSSPSVLSDFVYSVSSSANKIHSVSQNLAGVDEMPEANAWETKYGQINPSTTSCLKVGHSGNASTIGAPLGVPIVTSIVFNKPSPQLNWGFMVLDIDVDQVDIKAKDLNGNFYSDAIVSSWFKGVFDAATGIAASTSPGAVEPPCFDATTATVVASGHVASPCTRSTTIGTASDFMGAGAWFEPDMPVKELQFIMYNLQPTALPSQRYFIAAASTISVSGSVFEDVNANTIYGTGGTSGTTEPGSSGAIPLYAYLVQAGTVLDSALVNFTTGFFNFAHAPLGIGAASIQIGNNKITPGTAASGIINIKNTPPPGWFYIGSSIALISNGSSGSVNISLGISSLNNNNFGIRTFALDIKLLSFEVVPDRCSFIVKWAVADAVNFDHFEIQQDNKSGDFENLAVIPYKKNTNGLYQFKQAETTAGVHMLRLKMVDADGYYSYSQVLSTFSNCKEEAFLIYPNPLKNSFFISGLKKGELLNLFNANGQLLNSRQANSTQEKFEMPQFPTGNYILTVANRKGALLKSIKIIKLK